MADGAEYGKSEQKVACAKASQYWLYVAKYQEIAEDLQLSSVVIKWYKGRKSGNPMQVCLQGDFRICFDE